MENNFQIYPRGFLGKVTEDSVPKQRSQIQEIYDRLQYNANIFIPSGVQIPYSADAENLYNLHVRRVTDTMSFSYKENALRTALTAFGTHNFSVWVSLQRHNRAFGNTQRAFLKDTVKFLEKGERELSLENWEALLSAGADIECEETIQDILSKLQACLSNPTGLVTVRDVVKRWVSYYNGLNDLVVSLHILFGK